MSRSLRIALSAALLTIGATMVLLGIFHDEVIVILRKAIYICLECIGIG